MLLACFASTTGETGPDDDVIHQQNPGNVNGIITTPMKNLRTGFDNADQPTPAAFRALPGMPPG
jgi:hypothetical protein